MLKIFANIAEAPDIQVEISGARLLLFGFALFPLIPEESGPQELAHLGVDILGRWGFQLAQIVGRGSVGPRCGICLGTR